MTSPSEIPDALRERIEQFAADLDDIHFNSRHGSWIESAKELATAFALAVRNEAIAEERRVIASIIDEAAEGARVMSKEARFNKFERRDFDTMAIAYVQAAAAIRARA
jgi:hypothetical protein